jgi:threonylcarbamoyladenosine tRNA methylthiotransferase MtaB
VFSILIQTLGCKLNQLESESFFDAFNQAGFNIQGVGSSANGENGASPTIILINTCTVTSKADQKARRVIRKALRDYPDSCVMVTGCYAQLDKADLEKLDSGGRLFVLRGMEKEKILDLPRFINENGGDLCGALKSWQEEQRTDDIKAFQFLPERFSKHTRSFLKIQDGCDKHCTYCRIRLARGKSISLGAAEALERLKILEKTHAEAVLTGVNICQYREQIAKSKEQRAESKEQRIENKDQITKSKEQRAGNLTGLLEYLLAGTEKIAIRLSSLEPDYIDEELVKVLAHKRIRPHFHLSVQSGSAMVLQKMSRSYDAQIIERAVSLLRGAKDDPFLACDIITGFPGETEEEFEKTYTMCKKIGFAWIHVFPYSKRPGTPAFSFPDTVQEIEVTRRVQLLTDLAWQGRAEYVKRWIGREVEALVEKDQSNLRFGAKSKEQMAYCRGITENYLKVLIQYNGDRAPPQGTVLRCRLTEQGENLKHFDVFSIISNPG